MKSVTRLACPVTLIACLTLAAVACEAGHRTTPPAHSRDGAASGGGTGQGKGVRKLAVEYLAIAKPANRRLDVEVTGYAANAHHNLAAAESALRAQAATERRFDQQLLAIGFPPSIAATARALVLANQSRIDLTDLQAQSTSISALLTFTGSHRAVDAAVEIQVRTIRRELGLPPPSSS